MSHRETYNPGATAGRQSTAFVRSMVSENAMPAGSLATTGARNARCRRYRPTRMRWPALSSPLRPSTGATATAASPRCCRQQDGRLVRTGFSASGWLPDRPGTRWNDEAWRPHASEVAQLHRTGTFRCRSEGSGLKSSRTGYSLIRPRVNRAARGRPGVSATFDPRNRRFATRPGVLPPDPLTTGRLPPSRNRHPDAR